MISQQENYTSQREGETYTYANLTPTELIELPDPEYPSIVRSAPVIYEESSEAGNKNPFAVDRGYQTIAWRK